MGRLNSLIKFVVVNANVLLFLGGIGIIVVVSLVLTADFAKLAEVRTSVCIFMCRKVDTRSKMKDSRAENIRSIHSFVPVVK